MYPSFYERSSGVQQYSPLVMPRYIIHRDKKINDNRDREKAVS